MAVDDDLRKLNDDELLQRLEDESLTESEYETLRAEVLDRLGVDPELMPSDTMETGEADDEHLVDLIFQHEANVVGSFYAAQVHGNESDESHVSTVFRMDDRVYETMLFDLRDYGGESVQVERYDTREEAAAGHEKWTQLLITGSLPDPLIDLDGAEFPRCISKT